MNNSILLNEFHYMMDLCISGDRWALFGEVYGHPNFRDGARVFVSTPKYFDRQKREVTGASGRVYKLGTFCQVDTQTEESVFEQIEKDIKMGGWEIH